MTANPEKVHIMEKVRELWAPDEDDDSRYLCLILKYGLARGDGFKDDFECNLTAVHELLDEIRAWLRPRFPDQSIEGVLDPDEYFSDREVHRRSDEIRHLLIDALIAKYSGLAYEFPDISKWRV